jgi:bacteriorhodopsin
MSTSPNSSTSLIGIDTEKSKEEKRKNPVQHYVKFSFVLTYILLLTTGTITFIEAIRTQIPAVRHIMNLETAISVIAGYFYSVFVAQIDKFNQDDKPIEWKDITKTRYVDWAITTPLMLLVLCSVLGLNTNVKVKGLTILSVIVLNYLMLYTGYLGEVGQMGRFASMIIGFIPFVILFSIIFIVFVLPKYVYANYVLFSVFVSIWALYGFVYMLSEEYKNIAMNIMDCIAKCFVGIGLWMYYTKIIT